MAVNDDHAISFIYDHATELCSTLFIVFLVNDYHITRIDSERPLINHLNHHHFAPASPLLSQLTSWAFASVKLIPEELPHPLERT
jgi:hypothetical protein